MVENARSDLPGPAEDECNSSSLHFELQVDGFGSKNGIISSRSSAEDREKSDLDEKSDARSLPVAGSNAARYKLMSPARLPITRSPCLTIPPGLSPTALLESPVLLSNIKAEPSPTTGTFSMPPVLHNIYGSNSLSSPSRETQNNSTCNTGCASNFEFKPDIRSTSSFGFPSQGTSVSSWADYENVLISSQELMLPVSPPNPTGTMSNSMANGTIEVLHGDLPLREGPDDVTLACDHKEPNSLVAVEKSSEDGYNWRKYGQKHVKGSEFPRSYYKCTHPNCQVKKQLERSHDGQITEIVYKGKHDHPKPQTNRRLAVNIASPNEAGERSDDISAIHSKDNTLLGQGRTSHQVDLSGTSDFSPFTASDDDIDVAGAWSIKNNGDFNDEDDQETKRRKTDCSAVDTTPLSKMTREPRVVVQTLSNVDILDDGYRWRKYGQKVVKGNPNPRSYYKCTNAGCPVRKHVERACHDPKAVITTYEGKHNHDVPSSSRISRNVATLDTSNSLGNDGRIPLHQYVRPEQSDVVSLDLGMGFCSSSEDRSDEKQLEQGTESEVQVGVSDYRKANLAPPVSSYYGSGNHGASAFKSGKDQVDNFSFSVPHLTSQ